MERLEDMDIDELVRERIAAKIDAAIEKDIVLLWTPDRKRVITGADLLGRLLRGIDPEELAVQYTRRRFESSRPDLCDPTKATSRYRQILD